MYICKSEQAELHAFISVWLFKDKKAVPGNENTFVWETCNNYLGPSKDKKKWNEMWEWLACLYNLCDLKSISFIFQFFPFLLYTISLIVYWLSVSIFARMKPDTSDARCSIKTRSSFRKTLCFLFRGQKCQEGFPFHPLHPIQHDRKGSIFRRIQIQN